MQVPCSHHKLEVLVKVVGYDHGLLVVALPTCHLLCDRQNVAKGTTDMLTKPEIELVKGAVKERGETCDVTKMRSRGRSKKRRGNPQTR